VVHLQVPLPLSRFVSANDIFSTPADDLIDLLELQSIVAPLEAEPLAAVEPVLPIVKPNAVAGPVPKAQKERAIDLTLDDSDDEVEDQATELARLRAEVAAYKKEREERDVKPLAVKQEARVKTEQRDEKKPRVVLEIDD